MGQMQQGENKGSGTYKYSQQMKGQGQDHRVNREGSDYLADQKPELDIIYGVPPKPISYEFNELN